MLFLGSDWGEPRDLGTLKQLGSIFTRSFQACKAHIHTYNTNIYIYIYAYTFVFRVHIYTHVCMFVNRSYLVEGILFDEGLLEAMGRVQDYPAAIQASPVCAARRGPRREDKTRLTWTPRVCKIQALLAIYCVLSYLGLSSFGVYVGGVGLGNPWAHGVQQKLIQGRSSQDVGALPKSKGLVSGSCLLDYLLLSMIPGSTLSDLTWFVFRITLVSVSEPHLPFIFKHSAQHQPYDVARNSTFF